MAGLNRTRVGAQIRSAVWSADLSAMPRWRALALRHVRVFYMLVRDLLDGHLNLWASSLTFSTLLSLVPALAVSFSVLKAFGVHHELDGVLYTLLEPLGAGGKDIAQRILGFVENVQLRALGSAGLIVLLFTTLSMLHKVERAFTYTWRSDKPQSLAGRLSGYITVVLVGPVLVFSAIAVTASVMKSSLVQRVIAYEPLGFLVAFSTKAVPYLLIVAAFTFVYLYLPRAKVRARSALFGACIGGLLWALAGWVFAGLVVTSTNYTAIYSSFAIVILFFMWLYVGWLILLVGNSVVFYHQNPEYQGLLPHEARMSNRLRERIALLATFLIAQRYYYGHPPWTAGALARHLHVPLQPLEEVLDALISRGILLKISEDSLAFVPGRDLAAITPAQVLDAARQAGGRHYLSPPKRSSEAAVDELYESTELTVAERLGSSSVRTLVETNPLPPETPAESLSAISIDTAREKKREQQES